MSKFDELKVWAKACEIIGFNLNQRDAGWPQEFDLSCISKLQFPDSLGDERLILKMMEADCKNDASTLPHATTTELRNHSIAGLPYKDALVQAMREPYEVIVHRVNSAELSKWFKAQGMQPSEYLTAWFMAPKKGADISTTASTVAPVNDGPAPLNKIVHSTKTRRNTLTPVIEQAQKQCTNQQDTAAVWAALLVLAEKKAAPLIGATEDGLQYLKGGTVEIFTRKSLGKRLNR